MDVVSKKGSLPKRSSSSIAVKINSFEQSYVNMVKLSVAIAILKKKPATVSACEYTRRLSSAHLEQILCWEEKCLELEKLQQDTQLQCVAAAGGGGGWTDNHSGSYTDSSVFLTPPCSGPPIENPTAFHTNFLQSSYHLKSSLAILQDPKLMDRADESSMIKNIESSLNFLLADPTRIHNPNVKHSVKTIIDISKNVPPNSDFSCQLVDIVRQFFQSLIKDSLLNDNIEPVQKYEHMNLMCQFVASSSLQKTLFETLLRSVSQFSTYLQELCVGLQPTLDPVYFENNYYVMTCLSQCLVKATTTQQHPADLNTSSFSSLKDRIRTALENCLSLVVDAFPIFAHTVWYLLALLETNTKSDHNQKQPSSSS